MRKVWLSWDARHVAGSRLLKDCLLGGDVDIAPFSNCHPEGGTTEGSSPWASKDSSTSSQNLHALSAPR